MTHAKSEASTPTLSEPFVENSSKDLDPQWSLSKFEGARPSSSDADEDLLGIGSNESELAPSFDCFIGIDPGLSGGIAVIWQDRYNTAVFDMPVVPRLTGKGMQVSAPDLADLLRPYKTRTKAFVEQVQPMPKQGVTSMFHFGKSLGVVEGVLGTLGIPFETVRPQVWKSKARLIKKPKDASRTLAMQLFPELQPELKRKKDNGRAEALLIAHYSMR